MIRDTCVLFQNEDLSIDPLLKKAQELNLNLSYSDLIEQEVLTAKQLITLDPRLKNVINQNIISLIYQTAFFS